MSKLIFGDVDTIDTSKLYDPETIMSAEERDFYRKFAEESHKPTQAELEDIFREERK